MKKLMLLAAAVAAAAVALNAKDVQRYQKIRSM